MKKLLSTILLTGLIITGYSQTLKPYILAGVVTDLETAKTEAKAALELAGFGVAGEYMPAEDESRWIIIVNHPELDKAVQSVGGLTGFASTLRIGITKEEGGVTTFGWHELRNTFQGRCAACTEKQPIKDRIDDVAYCSSEYDGYAHDQSCVGLFAQ